MLLTYFFLTVSQFLLWSANCLVENVKIPVPVPVPIRNCDKCGPVRHPPRPSSCNAYEEQRICGPTCPMTCDTMNINVCCDVKCVRGCFCQDGYILLSNNGPRRCVPIHECPKPGILEFGNLTVTVIESTEMVVITILRLSGSAGEISVRWSTVEDTAKAGSDFVLSSGILTFPDGVTQRTLTVEIVDDSIRELEERFTVVLSDPTNRAELNPRRLEGVAVTIIDDDMRPGYLNVLKSSISIPESYGIVSVTLVRLGGADGVIQMKYRTLDGTAHSQTDYMPANGVVVFNEGEIRKTIQVTILNDEIREPLENFQLEFYDPSSAVINFRQLSSSLVTIVTITDDDMTPGYIEVETPTVTVPENVGTVNMKLVRLGGSDGQIKIKYRTADGTTIGNTDYVPITGEVAFDEGETTKVISLKIVDDDVREPIENFKFQLYDPSAASDVLNFRSLGNRLESTIVIMDNDMKPGYIEMPNPAITIPESVGHFKLNVVRVGGRDGEIRIRYRTVDGTATSTADYNPISGVLVFKDAETLKQIKIDIINDFASETREHFRFELYDASAASDVINFRGLGGRTSTIITIDDDDMKPGYLELERVNTTINENYGVLQMSIVRLEGADGILQMKYRTIDGTATAGKDYESAYGDLIFRDGEKRKTVSIPILNDNDKEIAENFHFQIYDVTAGAETINFRSRGSKLSTLITILDDDRTPGYVEMETPTLKAVESIGSILIPVKRIGGSDGELRVKYVTLDVTALAQSDYRPSSGILVFKEGEIRKLISIPIINDQVREITKTFQVKLMDLNPNLGQFNFRTLGSNLATTVSIIDDDEKPGLIEFEKRNLIIREDAGMAEITVLRVGGTDGTLTVNYKTIPGTALPLVDFVLGDGQLVFEDGVGRLTIKIRIVDDRIKEPTENFSLVIYEPGGLQTRSLGQITSVFVSITDNDNYPGVFEFQNVRISVLENVRTLSITVIRKEGTDGEIALQIRTISGTATEGVDYSPPPPVVIFPDGVREQSVQLRILDDNIKENSEEFFVGLFSPTHGGVLGSIKQTTIVIIDDDDPSVIRFQRRSGNYRESHGVAEIPVVRENHVDRKVSVYWKIEDRSAKVGEDYRRSSGDFLIFTPGQTLQYIRIEIMDDTQVESNEFFDVVLIYPSEDAVLGVPSRFTVGLLDNDQRVSTQPSLPSLPSLPSSGPYGGIQLSFRSQNIRVKENAGEVIISIVRSGSLIPISIQLKTEDGSAVGERDYRRTRGTVSFEDGDVELKIGIKIIDDRLAEPDETFTVVLLNPTAGILLGLKVVTVTIEDDDGDFTERRNSGGSLTVVTSRPRPVPNPVPDTYRPGLLTKCPDHLILKTCANTCPPTCASVFGKTPCSFDGCIRGCFCPDGFVKESESSDRCIRPSQCSGGYLPRERPPSNPRPFGII